MNGLDGGYTQILLNSRPIFTSLIGVYGLEQIPTNIIERIEVVRSGGSALYGSSAIAGTVNVRSALATGSDARQRWFFEVAPGATWNKVKSPSIAK